MNNLAAIVLAAGKGKRMNTKNLNKVVLPLRGKPMIAHTVDLLEALKIGQIIVAVGFAKKSVMEVLKDRVIFVQQRKRLGTAHAVFCALKYLPKNISDVLVLNGDDSAFYKEETINNLIKTQHKSRSSVAFLTIEVDNPSGLGRIVRDDKGILLAIIEDKDAKGEVKKIKEVNPSCYVFNVEFLRKYLKKVKKSTITGEYYLTALIDIAIKNDEKIETTNVGRLSWRGINTINELKEAEGLFLQVKLA